MGLFRRWTPVDTSDLRAELAAVRQALDEQEGSTKALVQQALDGLVPTTTTTTAPP